ncbi:MAG: hypothetical protein KatS3mg022_0865 [Armatimonadota bacterium]|nr:MAG: hypothetical protein KatS3mg022_0865 [Armatimonadota bacterium]
MGKSKEISLPAAITIIAIVVVVIVAIGWYMMNRNPAPPPPPPGAPQTTAPVPTQKGTVQGQTGAQTEY